MSPARRHLMKVSIRLTGNSEDMVEYWQTKPKMRHNNEQRSDTYNQQTNQQAVD